MSNLISGRTAPRIAVLGGVYSNYLALEAVCRDAMARGADEIYCLGDLGAFGPHPDRVFPLLDRYQVRALQGNYEDSLSQRRNDCNCGYTDPRDNQFAQISFDYTAEHTSEEFKDWMGTLPRQIRGELGNLRTLMVHGSPRKINEFLWYSTSSEAFLSKLLEDYATDLLLVTHTGLHWHRRMREGRHVVNVGVIGRPPNNGRQEAWYALLTGERELEVSFVPVEYDYQTLAREMEQERLPREFIDTIRTGWWTTCLEILPAKERAAGRY